MNKKMSLRKNLKNKQIGLNICFIILACITVYPFLLLLAISFSNENDIYAYGYSLIPKHIDFSAYRFIMRNSVSIGQGYKVTTLFSLMSMVFVTFFNALCAYPLSKKEYKYRKAISFYLYFTMLFGGGLVPSYILNARWLHLNDSIWIYVLPGMVSAWNVFMLRTFMQGVPVEMYESVVVDGGSEYCYFFKFVIPMIKPALATIALLTFLGKWNDWFTSLIYIENNKLRSLQYYLQEILQNLELLRTDPNNAQFLTADEIPGETVRMAMVVVVAGPALIIFPFFQKYFVRGMTVGSVKG